MFVTKTGWQIEVIAKLFPNNNAKRAKITPKINNFLLLSPIQQFKNEL